MAVAVPELALFALDALQSNVVPVEALAAADAVFSIPVTVGSRALANLSGAVVDLTSLASGQLLDALQVDGVVDGSFRTPDAVLSLLVPVLTFLAGDAALGEAAPVVVAGQADHAVPVGQGSRALALVAGFVEESASGALAERSHARSCILIECFTLLTPHALFIVRVPMFSFSTGNTRLVIPIRM